MAPKRTPQAIIDQLNAALNDVLGDAQAREKLAVMGITPTPGTPAQFGAAVQADLERYGGVVKAAGLKPQQ